MVFLKLAQQAHGIEENISDVYQMTNTKAGNEIRQRLIDTWVDQSFSERSWCSREVNSSSAGVFRHTKNLEGMSTLALIHILGVGLIEKFGSIVDKMAI